MITSWNERQELESEQDNPVPQRHDQADSIRERGSQTAHKAAPQTS
jgi:hypothetical protein